MWIARLVNFSIKSRLAASRNSYLVPRHYHGLPTEHEDVVLPDKLMRGRINMKYALKGSCAICPICKWIGVNPDNSLVLQGRQVASQLGELLGMVLILLWFMIAVMEPWAYEQELGANSLCLPPTHTMDATIMEHIGKEASKAASCITLLEVKAWLLALLNKSCQRC